MTPLSASKIITRHLLNNDLLKGKNIDTVILLDTTQLEQLATTIAKEILE